MLKSNFNPENVWGRCLLLALVYAILALIFQWASLHFGYKRHFLNAEILIAFMVFAMGFRWLSLLIFIGAIALELSLGLTTILYLFDYSQIMDIAGFALEAKKSYLFFLGLLLGLTAVCFWLASHCLKKIRWKWMLATVVMLFSSQVALSSIDILHPNFSERSDLLFGSSMHFTGEILALNASRYKHIGAGDANYIQIQHPSAATQKLDLSHPPQRILFVVAESWGQSKSPKIVERQIQALRDSKKIEELTLGKIHAVGATAVGELRELCGKIPTQLNFRKISRFEVGECMPEKLKKQGYKTIAIHGAHGVMYRRLMWYPVVGFDDMVFKEVLPDFESVQCHSFPGYCDQKLFEVILEKLTSNDKTFVYWLTLNSHTPYDERDVVNYRVDVCDSAFEGEYNQQLCNYQNLHVQFFEGLAKLFENQSMHGVEVVVVGDHAPIFNEESSRQRFELAEVPMLHFKVK
ncbi:Phosphoglycerol transferase, alkaline phosphatase superfamily [Hydrogenophaga sp. T4]|nr:Phosphoglycerol transferase, alkaline phosphatase superfamily [Hydrogenophaga sp. T4]